MPACMHGLSICSNYEYQYQIHKVQHTSKKGMQPLVSNSMVKLTLSYTACIWEKKLCSCPVGPAVSANCDVVFNKFVSFYCCIRVIELLKLLASANYCSLPLMLNLMHICEILRATLQGRNDVRWRPGQESSLAAPMFEAEVFRKQMYYIEESTCDIV